MFIKNFFIKNICLIISKYIYIFFQKIFFQKKYFFHKKHILSKTKFFQKKKKINNAFFLKKTPSIFVNISDEYRASVIINFANCFFKSSLNISSV